MRREIGQVGDHKVNIIESEAGWGSNVDETLYFSEHDEAIQYVNTYNQKHNPKMDDKGSHTPNWYMVAQYNGVVG